MDIKRLPPSLLVALGLVGCGPAVDDGSTGADSGDAQTSTGESTESVGPCLTPWGSTHDATSQGSVGPCLGMVGTTVGPCLLPELSTSSGTDTDTDTDPDDTDTGTSSGGGTDSGSTGGEDSGVGPCLVPPNVLGDGPGALGTRRVDAQSRSRILSRLLDADILPPDVAERLRSKD